MIEKCNHKIKINGYDIISTKDISRKEFECTKCNTKIRLKISKILTMLIIYIVSILTVLFIALPLLEILSSENFVVKFGYTILVIIGLVNIFTWLLNGSIWLFRKKIKYAVIEDEE